MKRFFFFVFMTLFCTATLVMRNALAADVTNDPFMDLNKLLEDTNPAPAAQDDGMGALDSLLNDALEAPQPPPTKGGAIQAMDALDQLLKGEGFGDGGVEKDKPAPVQKSLFRSLSKNAQYELETYITAYSAALESSADDAAIAGWTRLKASSEASVSDHIVINGTLSVTGATTGSQIGVFHEPGSRQVLPAQMDFDFLTARWEQPTYDVVLGKGQMSFGVAEMSSPNNRFATGYGGSPMEAFDTGVWQTRVNYYRNNDVLSVILMPFDDRASTFDTKSRWKGDHGKYAFAGIPPGVVLTDSFDDPTPRNWNWLAQYKGVAAGYDYFVLSHLGKGAFPVVHEFQRGGQQVREIVFPRSMSVGSGITGTQGRFKYYTEGIYQSTFNNKDDDYLRYVVGATYRETAFARKIGADELEPIVEYCGEVVNRSALAAGYSVASSSTRTCTGALAARLDIRVNETWKGSLGGSKDLTDKDAASFVRAEYRYSDQAHLFFDVKRFAGKSDTHFGRWRRNDHIRVGAKITF